LVAAAFMNSSNGDSYIACFQCNTTNCTAFGDPFPIPSDVSSITFSGNLVAVGNFPVVHFIGGFGRVTVFECDSSSCTPFVSLQRHRFSQW